MKINNQGKKTFSKTSIALICASSILLSVSTPTFAASSHKLGDDNPTNDIVAAINALTSRVTQIATTTYGYIQKAAYELAPNSAQTMAVNNAQTNAPLTAQQVSQQLTANAVQSISTVYDPTSQGILGGTKNAVLHFCGSDSNASCNIANSLATAAFGSGSGNILSPENIETMNPVFKNQSFSATSLWASEVPPPKDSKADPTYSLTYSPTGEALARAYLGFALGAKQIKLLANKNAVKLSADSQQDVLSQTRTYVARLSNAYDNLSYLYAQRVPQQGLNSMAGLNDPNNAQISEAALDRYIATRRVSNPKWYSDMAKSSPAAVQREMLNVLAEMQYQMYKTQQIDERILATASIQQLQQTQAMADPTPLSATTGEANGVGDSSDVDTSQGNDTESQDEQDAKDKEKGKSDKQKEADYKQGSKDKINKMMGK